MTSSTDETGDFPRAAKARVGRVLKNKWTLDRLLGAGGMAVVYAATHRNGQRVAIKMLHPDVASDEEIKARFLREGYLANAVGHPGSVRVFDDDTTDDGDPFLVMELLDGETVERRWRRAGPRLDPAEALAIANDVLEVLAAAHARGIVHRDVKPENVFLTRAGAVKILDFGIACLRQPSLTTATLRGVAMGTPVFMPPEQARGRWDEVDARSDLWSVGALLFALLTGRFVHQAETPNEELLAAMTVQAPALASVAPELPPHVARVVDVALAARREDRWSDARAMQAAIRDALAALAPKTSPSLDDGAPARRAYDPDKTDVMAPIDFSALHGLGPESESIGRGVAGTLIAAVPPSPARRRASPFLAGVSMAILGALLAMTALVPRPAPSAVALAPTVRVETSVAAAPPPETPNDPGVDPALETFPAPEDLAPAPPATGAPAELGEPPAPDSSPAHLAARAPVAQKAAPL
jgi:serine/threonine-protein kinase